MPYTNFARLGKFYFYMNLMLLMILCTRTACWCHHRWPKKKIMSMQRNFRYSSPYYYNQQVDNLLTKTGCKLRYSTKIEHFNWNKWLKYIIRLLFVSDMEWYGQHFLCNFLDCKNSSTPLRYGGRGPGLMWQGERGVTIGKTSVT